MPQGFLSARINTENPRHHLWLNNGTWWCHFVLHFDFRARRIRRSLGTTSLDEAIRRRDALFAKLSTEGEWVPERGEERPMPERRRISVIRDLGNVIRRFSPLGC
jgi:hypothetical protein